MPRKTGFSENSQAAYASEAQRSARHERVRLGEAGRVVIPAAMREAMGVKPGDALIARVEDGELHLRSWLGNLKRIQAELSALKKSGESAVDAFLKERRAEQRRSDERFDRLHAEGVTGKKKPRK